VTKVEKPAAIVHQNRTHVAAASGRLAHRRMPRVRQSDRQCLLWLYVTNIEVFDARPLARRLDSPRPAHYAEAYR
jgi:hypothetical protein